MAVLRFVDSIQSSPTVRLNLNDLTTWGMDKETSFGIPEMKRSITSSMMRDGDYVGATAYGNRVLNLVLQLYPAGDTAATQLQALQRELDRPTNLLQYTPGGVTNTVFFRTFRTSPENVRWDINRKEVRVSILAEPFALGLREDISAVVVNNAPTAANGMFINLTGIKGDVDTPLYIEYQDSTSTQQRAGYCLGVRSGASPYPNLYNQAEQYTMVTDTAGVADAAFSNGSKARCLFTSTSAMTVRLVGNLPALADPAGAENWGAFRVFARVAKTVAGDLIRMAARTGAGNYNPSVTLKNQTGAQMVDLGVFDSTAGLPEAGGFTSSSWRIEDQAGLFVAAERASGSGSLDMDYLVYVPADEWLCSWPSFPAGVASTSYLGVVDGPNDAIYAGTVLTGGTPGRSAATSTSISGRLPRVQPGDNRLVIVETSRFDTSGVGVAHTLATAASFVCRYWPKYLLVRPVST